jgi:hypothetical protein
MAWSQPKLETISSPKKAVTDDELLSAIRELCKQGMSPHPSYTIHADLLYWKDRMVLPQHHPLIQQILHEFHSSPLGCHARVARTVARVPAQFYWKGMHQDVATYVKECLICQQEKSSNMLPSGLLQPPPIPNRI